MPLLHNGQWAKNNPWTRLEDTDAIPGDKPQQALLCSMDRYLAMDPEDRYRVSGIWLTPDDQVKRLRDDLERVQMIAIDFPVYSDGRGYSQARQLRNTLGFSGELRACGDVRPDQILFMVRAGIDTFDFSDQPDTELVESILSRYSFSYQPSYALPIAG